MKTSSLQNEMCLPTFHDARLSGLLLLPNRECSLFITNEAGVLRRLILMGVERLRADDFREGNIILDVTVQTGDVVRKTDVLFAVSLDDEKSHVDFFHAIMARIGRGELILVQVNPSYGCTFCCLCASWRLEDATS